MGHKMSELESWEVGKALSVDMVESQLRCPEPTQNRV